MNIRQVDDINCARSSFFNVRKWVFGISDENPHPVWAFVKIFSQRISLRQKFCHRIFGINFFRSETFLQNPEQFVFRHFLLSALHSSGFNYRKFLSIKMMNGLIVTKIEIIE